MEGDLNSASFVLGAAFGAQLWAIREFLFSWSGENVKPIEALDILECTIWGSSFSAFECQEQLFL